MKLEVMTLFNGLELEVEQMHRLTKRLAYPRRIFVSRLIGKSFAL